MADEGKNIRSVIKNATLWISKKVGEGIEKMKGIAGKGDTIATKDEINQSKAQPETPKMGVWPKLWVKWPVSLDWLKNKLGSDEGRKELLSQVKWWNNVWNAGGGENISQQPPVSSPFENQMNEPINNINVEQINNESLQSHWTADISSKKNSKDNIFINWMGRATELKTPVDVDNALGDLFLDVREKVKNGTLAMSDLAKMKQVYPEFAWLKDDVLLSMIWDMGSMVNAWLTLNDANLEKLKELYPELTSVSWNLAMPTQQNMYQAWWMKEAITSASSIDLNNYWTAGAIAEWVINPIWETFTLMDAAAQNIPQVDSNTEFTWQPALERRLASLTQEDIDKYYQRYLNAIEENPTLTKAWTKRVPWNTVVSQLWNIVTGNTYTDYEAWFRDWLIDQVNLEENGWKGEFFGAADDLHWIVWPNIARMYANMPASAVKTTTAIAKAITNPVDTAQWLVVLVKDWWENAQNGTFSESMIGQRYWSWEAFANAMEQDPVWVSSDMLAVAELGTTGVWSITKAGRWGSKWASMATRALGAEKTSNNLMKIANRLKSAEGKMKDFAKATWGASDMGLRQLFYGMNGKGWLIWGLEKWAWQWNSFYNKAAKYMVKTQQPFRTTVEEVKKIGEAWWPIWRIAEGITGVSSAEWKLFKAASPNLNTLRNNVDYKNKKANMDTATRAIVEAGYTPKTIEEWAKAHMDTLNSKWKEFTNLIKDKKDVTVDAKELLREVKNWLVKEKEGATVNQRWDIAALEREIADLERRGSLDMEFLENRKEHYNSSYKDADKMKKWDIYEKWIKNIWNAIRKAQDNILWKGPESMKKLRNEIKALMDTKDDVQKANVRRQKQKDGGGLIENYGRISWLWDILEGAFKTVTGRIKEWVPQATKWLGKVVLWKALWRAKDVDFLTETWFKGLKKKAESKWWVKTAVEGKWNEEKEVKMTWNIDEKPYNSENNLNSNQKNNGLTKKSQNDTWKGKENLWWMGKQEEKNVKWGVWGKTSSKAWNDGGRVSQKDWGYLEIKENWEEVVGTLEKIKAENPDGYKMDIHWSADYGNWKRKTFQSKDGNSSVTVKEDGDITSLVSKPWLKRGKELVLTAIKNWGDKLDCYEEYLPTMYQKAGFEPVARVKFNPEYAPADWKGKGQDIIVMMRRNNDSVETVAENWGKYEMKDLDDLPVMEYDDALAYRDMLLEQKKQERKSKWEPKKSTKNDNFLNKKVLREELKKNIEIYDEAKVEYDNYLDGMADKIGGKPIKTSIKMRTPDGTIREDGIDRILEKQDSKGGFIGAVKDIVRGSIIVDNMEGINKAIKELEIQWEVVDNKFKNPTPMWYKDLSYNKVVDNWVPTEVQINVPEMLVAKEGENAVKWWWITQEKYDSIVKRAGEEWGKWHKYYEQWRKLDEKYKKIYKWLKDDKGLNKLFRVNERKMNKLIEIEKEQNRLIEESKKYYRKFEDLIG